MVIVETQEQIDACALAVSMVPSIVIPVFSDVRTHAAANQLSVLFIRTYDGQRFVLPFEHNEGIRLSLDVLSFFSNAQRVFSPVAKALSHHISCPIIDVKGMEYLVNSTTTDEYDFYVPIQQQMYNKYRWHSQINDAIPLMMLIDYLDRYAEAIQAQVGSLPLPENIPGFTFHNDIVIPACAFMESDGMHVDSNAFIEKFGIKSQHLIHDDLVYTEYHPYTLAGRVSSKFGGISFTSLNKSDGTRSMFTSRYDHGRMILIDFESFHLRLMGNLMAYDLPTESLHTFFGKQYFDVETLTSEQYDESKRRTFSLLYGDHKETDIPFFRQVHSYVSDMWSVAQSTGHITSPTGRNIYIDRIDDPSPSKLFNYMLQLREMEVGMQGIYDLQTLYTNRKAHVVLYTYDSILIDLDSSEGAQILKDTAVILSQRGQYPVRIYMGHNYHDLTNITDKVMTY